MTEQYRTEKVVFGPAGTGGVLITVLVLMEVEGKRLFGPPDVFCAVPRVATGGHRRLASFFFYDYDPEPVLIGPTPVRKRSQSPLLCA